MKTNLLSNVSALLAAACVAASPSLSHAENPADVSSILAQMRQASGGDAWASIHALHIMAATGGTSVARDTWEDVATGRYIVKSAGPDGAVLLGFDGITNWRQDRNGVAYSLGDIDSSLVSADESFRVARAWWFRDRHPATVAYLGRRSENGRSFDVLAVTPEGGRLFEAWIDRATHLLSRTDEQQAETRMVTDYADYRAVKGLMIPFTIRIGDGGDKSFDDVETVRGVEINPEIPDSQYSIPTLPASDIHFPAGHDSVEVPFRLASNNVILVPITLNGRVTVEADFDSGGSLLLQPATVVKLGAASSGRYKESGGGEGATTSTVGKLETLQIGDAQIPRLSFDCFAFDSNAPDTVLVGLEILQRFVVRFDFDRMVMTLTRPEAFRYSGTGAIVPFHFQDNQPEVRGSVDGIAGLFAIDTGDNSSLLLIAPFARRYGLVERYQADIPYDGTAVGTTHGVWARKRAGIVALDGSDGRPAVEVREPVTRISLQQSGFDANRNVSANIGLGYLRQFNLTFDYPRQRLIFEPNHFFGQRDIFNRTGFRLERKDAAWTITAIYPKSPAAEAGLNSGDRVLTIGGRAVDAFSGDALASTLKGPVGTHLVLQVKTPTGTRTVELVLREVI